MKQMFSVLFTLLTLTAVAQSIGIGTTTPEGSAMLDISSSTKGLLIPRMSTIERTTIAGPAIGLIVFDNTTASFWVYRGDVNGGWQELLTGLNKHWETTGSNIYNTNVGNVGIGTNNPGEKLSLNAPNAAIQFLNSGIARGYLQVSSTDMKLGTYANNTTGSIIFNTKAVDRMWIDENGRVGIGTASPTTALTINGNDPILQMRNGDVNKGFIQLSGDDVRVGTNSTNTNGNLLFQTKLINRMAIDENGLVGIGTSNPTSILSISSSNPTIQLKNSGTDKGFVQLSGDDIKIGTNIGNTAGKFIVRTNGKDHFSIDEDGYASLGSATGNGSLEMNGATSSGLILKHANLVQGFVRANSDGLEIYRNTPGFINIKANGTGIYLLPQSRISMGGAGASATGYAVSVEGKLIATAVTALPFGAWPDYVFDKDYSLRPLDEVKQFIKQNKHLPGIPSAAEVEKTGVELGDMSKRLMEKIEELTLYILQQQEQIDDLKKKVNQRPSNPS